MRRLRHVIHSGAMALGIAAVVAATLVTPASADTASVLDEGKCNTLGSLCNRTFGSGLRVNSVRADRTEALGQEGFFQLIGPRGYKKTGDTVRFEMQRGFEVNRSFVSGDLLCVQFWRKNGPGHFTQMGGNVCTSVPIS